ncbi:hypothetical protein DICVIV_05853 [Dictyocaulus viviparus]|uniref:Uncharacterized protein n=1 Tax=Dictyocaulus viviparus TaxID=29172 RepID=A0A0D8XTV0_DICVI|nr:hypothetical protein DICVIV_05853 [Dictyocaulus viviparus]
MFSELSVDSSWPSSSSTNLGRLRSSLGHSDPQISTSCTYLPLLKNDKKSVF